MPVEEKEQLCRALVQKMTVGDPLNADEKSHLASCECCMSQVITTLDEAAMSKSLALGIAARGTNGDLAQARPEAKKAAAHGHEVFEREFGISLSKE